MFTWNILKTIINIELLEVKEFNYLGQMIKLAKKIPRLK